MKQRISSWGYVTLLFGSMLLAATACRKGETARKIQLSADKTELVLPGEANYSESLTITSNASWEIAINNDAEDWLEVDRTYGSGDAVVHLKTTKEIGNTSTREALVTLISSEGPMPLKAVTIKVSRRP